MRNTAALLHSRPSRHRPAARLSPAKQRFGAACSRTAKTWRAAPWITLRRAWRARTAQWSWRAPPRDATSSRDAAADKTSDRRRERLNVADRRQGNGGRVGDFRSKAFLIGLGLGGLLELLFHWLEGGGEHGGGQLGNVPAITDSGFNPFLDQPLLQFDELRRAFHCGQRLHRSGQVLGILGRQFLIRPGQLLNSGSRGIAAHGQSLSVALHDFLCCFAALGWRLGGGFGNLLTGSFGHD